MQVLIASVGKSPGLVSFISICTKAKTSGLRLKDSDTVFNGRAVHLNASIVDYCRTSAAAIWAAASMLGLTGLNGFAFFIIFSLALADVGHEGWISLVPRPSKGLGMRLRLSQTDLVWWDDWRPVYLCTLMDFPLWHSTCILSLNFIDSFLIIQSVNNNNLLYNLYTMTTMLHW